MLTSQKANQELVRKNWNWKNSASGAGNIRCTRRRKNRKGVISGDVVKWLSWKSPKFLFQVRILASPPSRVKARFRRAEGPHTQKKCAAEQPRLRRWTSFVEPKGRREKKLVSATIFTLRCARVVDEVCLLRSLPSSSPFAALGFLMR